MITCITWIKVNEMVMGNPEIEWALLDGSEELADFEEQKGGSQIQLTARKEGSVYLAVSIPDQAPLGTAILRLTVEKAVPSSAYAPSYEYVYTGEPIVTGSVVRSSQGVILEEGKDYTVEYANNVRCGAADITVLPAGGGKELRAHFMIVPAKAEISGVIGGDGPVLVTVADQWATGISGYEIEYRKEGEDNWQTVTLTDGQTETELQQPDAGAVYEVRARATVDGVMPIIQLPTPCYGEYSDTATVTVP